MRYILAFTLLVVAIFAGYMAGRLLTSKQDHTELIENYSFVKDIAELASVEVTGTTTLNSSNVANDGSLTDELKRLFMEKTIRLSAPYTANYGIDLNDSKLRIVRADSTLKVYLPSPRLLSYELHLNRLDASNRKGWLQFESDEAYLAFQKKMYNESRSQLEKNQIYLQRSRDRICWIIQKYFAPLHVKTVCVYNETISTPVPVTP